MYLILSILIVSRSVTVNSRQRHYYVDGPTSYEGGRENLLYLADIEAKYSQEEAKAECLKLKMTRDPYLTPFIATTLNNNEFWVPHTVVPGTFMKSLKGSLKRVRQSERHESQRKGFLCAAALRGAVEVRRNGTSSLSAQSIPPYCHPQTVLSEHDLDELQLVMCLLVR